MEINSENNLRKAAILLSTLDDATADVLLRQLPPSHATRLRLAADDLENVSAQERRQVLNDFRHSDTFRTKNFSDGVEIDDSLIAKMSQSPEVGAGTTAANMSTTRSPFSFLQHADSEELARILSAEQPQTIAVVLSHLKPETAANVLTQLTPEYQAAVARRLIDLEATDPEIILEVERALEALFHRPLQSLTQRTAGMAALNSILEAVESTNRSQLVANLIDHDKSLAHAVQYYQMMTPTCTSDVTVSASEPMAVVKTSQPQSATSGTIVADGKSPLAGIDVNFNFPDFASLSDDSLFMVLKEVDADIAQLALVAADPALMRRVLGRFPSRQAKQLRQRLCVLGPTRLSDLERAKNEVTQSARRLIADGVIENPKVKQSAVGT